MLRRDPHATHGLTINLQPAESPPPPLYYPPPPHPPPQDTRSLCRERERRADMSYERRRPRESGRAASPFSRFIYRLDPFAASGASLSLSISFRVLCIFRGFDTAHIYSPRRLNCSSFVLSTLPFCLSADKRRSRRIYICFSLL